MSFKGFTYKAKRISPDRSLNGFYGFRITLNLTGVKVIDFRGRGQSGVTLIADNPISGTPFVGVTDINGSVFMQLDDETSITIQKEMITKVVQYTGEISPIYEIDLPLLS